MLVMLYVQIQQNTRRTRKPPDMWKRIGEWAAGNKPENMPDQVNKALALVAEWQPEKPGYLALCVKSKGLRPSKNMEAIAGLETCISLTPAGRIA